MQPESPIAVTCSYAQFVLMSIHDQNNQFEALSMQATQSVVSVFGCVSHDERLDGQLPPGIGEGDTTGFSRT